MSALRYTIADRVELLVVPSILLTSSLLANELLDVLSPMVAIGRALELEMTKLNSYPVSQTPVGSVRVRLWLRVTLAVDMLSAILHTSSSHLSTEAGNP